MDCPVCRWPLEPKLQWKTHGYGCAIWRCEACESDIAAKTPVSKFRNGFVATPTDQLTDAESQQCLSILTAIRAILEDSRPSALKAQLEEVLNDGS